MKFTVNWIIFSAVAIAVGTSIETPKYILPCQRSDPQINQCIKRSFNHLKPFLGKGLPEINVPPLEPLLIEQMNMDNDAGAVRIKARFSDILAKGASNYTIKEVRSDVKKLRFDMRLTIPRVEARGKYEIVGNVLLLPVRSNGEFWAEFTDITAVIKVYGKETTRENVAYMHIEKLGLDFTMKNARFKVKDNINSQNVLGEAINQFLNTNANDLVQEMRPAASQSIGRLFKKILNSAFGSIPMRQWLLA